MLIHRMNAVSAILCSIAIGAAAAHAPAGAPVCCDPINPPDQSLDLPDLAFTDANGDGIDGMACGPIFVALTGSDMSNGTMDSPMRTISAASLAASLLTPIRDVYISGGVYEEEVNLLPGVNLFGGYDSNDWSRTGASITTIRSNNVAMRYAGDPSAITIQLVTIESLGNNAPSGHSVGLYVDSAGAIIDLEAVGVITGDAGNGTAGGSGSTGSNGNNGNNASGSSRGLGATGGGGHGGNGRFRDSGLSGQSGSGGAPGGQGGNDGIGCSNGNPETGSDGADGVNGASGANGSGGTGFHQSGLPGDVGTAGGGGGGGGAGAGEDCADPFGSCVVCGTGRGGGGGGAGGQPGGGGSGGKPGGSSVALLVNAGAVNIAADCLLFPGNGGDGGNGGEGGAGGNKGNGGNGASSSPNPDVYGAGGDGGNGGVGGAGGHGGGGVGGWSAGAIFNSSNAAVINDAGATITPGFEGAGGLGSGNAGEDGSAITISSMTMDLPGLPNEALPVTAHARGITEPGMLVELDYAIASTACVPVSLTIAAPPSQGVAQAVGLQLFYTPGAAFTGEMTFQFNIIDNTGQCALGSAHVTVREPGADPCAEPCIGDLNGDDVIDTADLGILIGAFGTNCAP